MSGYVNKQNFWHWSDNNPMQTHKKLHSEKETVWLGVTLIGVIGYYFFEESNQTIFADSESYYITLQTFLAIELMKDEKCMVSTG